MKIFTECISCFFDQIDRSIRLLAPGEPEESILLAQQELMKVIADKDLSQSKNHELSVEVYRIIGDTLHTRDPFKEQKKNSNRSALDLVPQVKEILKSSKNILTTALRFSILGNSIDYGAPHNIDINKEIELLEKNDLGGPNNIALFMNSLKNAKNILILGDNAGEIVFDKIFIETVLNYFSDKEISYSVRKGPIINDSTIVDANFVGLNDICEVIESSATAGISLADCSPEFIKKFKSADLILSKGQGNFETMIDIPAPWAETYFLLKAKCKLMEKIFAVPNGTLLLVKKEDDLVNQLNSGKFRNNSKF